MKFSRCLFVTLLLTFSATIGVAGTAAGDSTPYTDPAVVAALTLCDAQGEALTSGSISEAPFVWRAVSSDAGPAPYNGDGRTATLFAFQPREGVAPSGWSGDLLTASARYTNSGQPMAQATRLDGSLADFLDAYPPQWEGYIQLRIYLSAPQMPALTSEYGAADIRVSGDKWTLVNGGTQSQACSSGRAVSLESLLPGANSKPGKTTDGLTGGGTGAGSGDGAKNSVANSTSHNQANDVAAVDDVSSSEQGSAHVGLWLVGAVLPAFLCIVLALAFSSYRKPKP